MRVICTHTVVSQERKSTCQYGDYQLEVTLLIVVLLTVVARVLNTYTSNKLPGDALSLCESVPQTDHIPFPPSLRLSVHMPLCFWHFRQNAALPLGCPTLPSNLPPPLYSTYFSVKKSVVITVYRWKSDSLHKRTGSDLIKKWNFRSPRVTYSLTKLRPSVMQQRRHHRIKANGAFILANLHPNSPVFPH